MGSHLSFCHPRLRCTCFVLLRFVLRSFLLNLISHNFVCLNNFSVYCSVSLVFDFADSSRQGVDDLLSQNLGARAGENRGVWHRVRHRLAPHRGVPRVRRGQSQHAAYVPERFREFFVRAAVRGVGVVLVLHISQVSISLYHIPPP